jgi:hypothetical protein
MEKQEILDSAGAAGQPGDSQELPSQLKTKLCEEDKKSRAAS